VNYRYAHYEWRLEELNSSNYRITCRFTPQQLVRLALLLLSYKELRFKALEGYHYVASLVLALYFICLQLAYLTQYYHL